MASLLGKIESALLPKLYRRQIKALKSAPTPVNEEARLATLKGLNVLDTPAEERFDRITRTASQLFAVPISLVTLVDTNRQWFKSCYGVSLQETPRSISFCSYAILQDGVFVIEDTLKDKRFVDNPLVTGVSKIRFYAGKPVHGPDGLPVGTLCLLDRKPREFSAQDKKMLVDMAAWVELELNAQQLSHALEERKKAESALRVSEKKYRSIFERVQDIFFQTDVDGRIVEISPSVKAFSGYTRSEVKGKFVRDFFTDQDAIDRLVFDVEKHGQVQAREFVLRRKDKKKVFVSVNVRLLKDEHGEIFGMEGTARDVTDHKALEHQAAEYTQKLEASVAKRTRQLEHSIVEIKKAQAKEKELEELKNTFIRVVSHQLRTPLNAIRWNLEMLLSEQLGKLKIQQKEFIRLTYTSDIEVIRRIDDLLTAMDIEEGRIRLQKEQISIESLFASVWGTWQQKAKVKELSLVYTPAKTALPEVDIDQDKIRAVFDKLLDNAVTYTKEKGVVRASFKKVGKHLRFELKDTGIGIPPAEQARIFQRFYRASNAASMKPDASGLGLCIAKYFIEQHRGKLGFDSEDGKGSTFWLTIPLRKSKR